MKFKLLSFTIFISLTPIFANDLLDTYNKATFYEQQGDIKNAMIWYKKAAQLSLDTPPKDTNTTSLVKYGNNTIDAYEDKTTNQTVKKIIFSAFDIEPYKMNYLLPVTYDSKNHTAHDGNEYREDFETKFQISFKKSLFENIFGLNDKLYLAYTQVSWWQTSAPSAPFRETNYEPEIFLDIPYMSEESILKSYRFGLVHQSNGRLLTSRSWNRIYASGMFQYGGIFFEPKVWYRFKEDKKLTQTTQAEMITLT